MSVDNLAKRLLAAVETYRLEGITFLGGEPLLQAQGLSAMAKVARDAGLTVMLFPGFTLEECRSNPLPGVEELLALADVLIDGPYIADRPESLRNWIGSANQRFHYFTGAYGPEIETSPLYRGQIEIRAEEDVVSMNGSPVVLPLDFMLKAQDGQCAKEE